MNRYAQLKAVGRRYQSITLPGMTVNVLLVALSIQKELKTLGNSTGNELHQFWDSNITRIAKREIDLASEVILVDKSMALEIARRLYFKRAKEWLDPSYILCCELPFYEYFQEQDGLTADVDYRAFNYLLENINKYRDRFSAIFNSANTDHREEGLLLALIMEDLEVDNPNVTKFNLRGMRAVIEKSLYRIIGFMSNAQIGNPYPGANAWEYYKAVMTNLGLDETSQRVALEAITGSKERPAWKDLTIPVNMPGESEDEDKYPRLGNVITRQG